ncbi:4-hydroxy-tetrahydrodipicolinate synthase [Endozoicomonas euniceicola]|uniref:4-hydroxy-tetrahydrodipicolinate synthase n=1 Tax=Endozoicomonas euniceicola TaxID=1234143 RepID=A0ABY6GVH6_9GAMM|nr:4-hydroxy-tetrahydrodipicolinate synthase [Endozoicomonas euniceicola]UYM16769.1 4-hydroxy-tetrahydrodipicolinate synthase [Endozoicomonas euniceicola]
MITGSLVALVTPMTEDGDIDWQRLHDLVEFHIQEGTDGIVAVGTTGESATLTVPEHCEVIKRIVGQVNGRIPVLAGTGGNSTQEAILLTAEAKSLGADACLLVTPYYNKPTQEGLYRHFKAIADAVDIPQILYNVPGRTAVDMLPETVARLAGHRNIAGIKEATGILERGRQIRELCGESFAIYSGDDATGMELMLQGANGVISVTNNVVPRQMHDLCMAAMAGDRETATAINNRLKALHCKLFVESNPIPVKWLLKEQGLIQDGIRLPLTPLSETFHSELRSALKQATEQAELA